MAGLHLPRIDKQSRLRTLVGILQAGVHLRSVVVEGVAVEVVHDVCHAGMLPRDGAVGLALLLIERVGAQRLGDGVGVEGPQRAVGEVATHTQRVGHVLGVVHRLGPLLREPCGARRGAVATHRIYPRNLHTSKALLTEPLELVADIIL